MPQQINPDIIIDGTLYTLIVFSILTWTIILFKIWQFSKNAFNNRRYAEAFWDSADLAAAQTLPEAICKGSKARLAERGFQWLKEYQQPAQMRLKYVGTPAELLEHALLVRMQKEQRSMDSGLVLLASIGSTAPFVGLFGTVLGIMAALQDITRTGSTSLDAVAGPIGDALIATAVGIAVAVPAVLAYNGFLRSAKKQRSGLENFVTGFMHVALVGAINV